MYPAAHLQFFLRTKFAKKLALQAHVTLRTGVSVRSVRDAKRGRHPAARSPKLRRLVQGGVGVCPSPSLAGYPGGIAPFLRGAENCSKRPNSPPASARSRRKAPMPRPCRIPKRRPQSGGVVDASAVPRRRLEKHPRGSFARAGWPPRSHQGCDTPAKAAKAQIGGCARRRTQALCPRAWA